ncbi:MAG: hypothetical protein ACLTBV_14825 [Enterocloster bolteae]
MTGRNFYSSRFCDYQGAYREGIREELIQLSHGFQVETGMAGRRDCP